MYELRLEILLIPRKGKGEVRLEKTVTLPFAPYPGLTLGDEQWSMILAKHIHYHVSSGRFSYALRTTMDAEEIERTIRQYPGWKVLRLKGA